jgi:hypothetical protein
MVQQLVSSIGTTQFVVPPRRSKMMFVVPSASSLPATRHMFGMIMSLLRVTILSFQRLATM